MCPLSLLQIGNMEEFLPVLFSAKEKGLKLALHLSEVCLEVLNTVVNQIQRMIQFNVRN